MLCSISRFDRFERPEAPTKAAGPDPTEGTPSASRRVRQTEKVKCLGVADIPVFQSAMQKLVVEGGVQPRYVEIKPLIRPLLWQDLPQAVSPAGGHVPEVTRTQSLINNVLII